MRICLLVLLIVGCAREHEVRLLLGPDEQAITIGFRCRQAADPTKFLFARAVQNGEVRFNLVVDIVGFGGRYPGCRGEELVAACPDRTSCRVLQRPGRNRFCMRDLHFSATNIQSPEMIRQTLIDQLRGSVVVGDAPDTPVLIRAVATTEDCTAIEAPEGDTYPDLDENLAVGCAYSCPVVLDDVQDSISLSLDVLDDLCEQTVRVCAAFPAVAQ